MSMAKEDKYVQWVQGGAVKLWYSVRDTFIKIKQKGYVVFGPASVTDGTLNPMAVNDRGEAQTTSWSPKPVQVYGIDGSDAFVIGVVGEYYEVRSVFYFEANAATPAVHMHEGADATRAVTRTKTLTANVVNDLLEGNQPIIQGGQQYKIANGTTGDTTHITAVRVY